MANKGEDQAQSNGNSSRFYKGAIVLYKILDVEAVPVDGNFSSKSIDASKSSGPTAGQESKGQPSAGKHPAIRTYVFNSPPQILSCDVGIAGGGMGGLAAALAIGQGVRAVLTEETSWLGGQLSSQGVSALDENKYVESSGACANYLHLRQQIRESYRLSSTLTDAAAADPLLNPGACWVTRLAFAPAIALEVIDQMLAPQIDCGSLVILKRTKIVAVHLVGDNDGQSQSPQAAQIDALLAVNLDSGEFFEIQCKITIDATELGDLMPLAKIPYQTGSDSRWVTGEQHAPELANPDNVQDYTYPFVLTYHVGQNHTIEKPADYDSFVAAGKFSFDGYKMFEENDDVTADGKKRHLLPFWTYRRLIDKDLFKDGVYQSDISMINWDSNDLRGKNIIDKTPEVQSDYLSLAKRISLGFLYWLQTTAPRDDGGQGYPELKLDFEVLGTKDGLSKYPYIREARRLAATTTIVEQDIVEAHNPLARARLWSDSCGIGLYPVDIHGYQEIAGAAQQTKPFQVPVGALLTDYCANFIAACKNIGVTHITNGAYRLHPIEWAIGTAAGAIAKLSLMANKTPLDFAAAEGNLFSLQVELTQTGAPIFWFDDLPPGHHCFAAAQVLAANGLISFDQKSLSFDPTGSVSEEEIDSALAAIAVRFGPLIEGTKTLTQMKEQWTGLSRAQLANGLFNALLANLARGEARAV